MLFNLKKKSSTPDNKSDFLMKHHELWRGYLKDNNGTFLMLYDDFNKFLPELSTGALKLYLFYGFSSKNTTGESWYGIDTIAKTLDTTSRSINSWNNELEELGLIYRAAGNKSSTTTYLIPYSDYTVHSNDLLKDFMDDYKTNDYINNTLGRISKIYHLYQWRKGDDEKKFDGSLNIVVVEFIKDYIFSKSTSNNQRKKKFVFNLTANKELDFNLESKYMDDKIPILLFDSPLEIEGVDLSEIEYQSVIIHPRLNLLNSEYLEEILKEFDEEVDFNTYKNYNEL